MAGPSSLALTDHSSKAGPERALTLSQRYMACLPALNSINQNTKGAMRLRSACYNAVASIPRVVGDAQGRELVDPTDGRILVCLYCTSGWSWSHPRMPSLDCLMCNNATSRRSRISPAHPLPSGPMRPTLSPKSFCFVNVTSMSRRDRSTGPTLVRHPTPFLLAIIPPADLL